MPGETNSPNMNLPVPGAGVTTGPAYATDVNNSLTIIDGHNHAAGAGVQINPSGININADLTFVNNNAVALRTVRFTSQLAALSLPADLICLYGVGNDLYFNDGVGNQIRITQSGSVAGSSGTITGLPSGTASAAYNAGSSTFIFQSATNTAATMDVGTVTIRNLTASANGVSLEAPAALGASYSLVMPAIPAVQSIMTLDNAGNMAAPYTLDNSTIVSTANVIKVPTGGITTTQIANNTITSTNIAVGGITGSSLANGTVTNTQIANSTIAGGKLVTNVDLPGLATANGKNIVVASFAAAYALEIVRATVDLDGAGSPFLVAGEGCSVVFNSGHTYDVTFTVAFADRPVITISGDDTAGYTTTPNATAPTTAGFSFTTTANNGQVSFIAIGRR